MLILYRTCRNKSPVLNYFCPLKLNNNRRILYSTWIFEVSITVRESKTYRKYIVKLSQHPEFSPCTFAFPLGMFFAFFLLFSFSIGDANKSKNTCSSERHKNPTEGKKKYQVQGLTQEFRADLHYLGCLSQTSLLALMMS